MPGNRGRAAPAAGGRRQRGARGAPGPPGDAAGGAGGGGDVPSAETAALVRHRYDLQLTRAEAAAVSGSREKPAKIVHKLLWDKMMGLVSGLACRGVR